MLVSLLKNQIKSIPKCESYWIEMYLTSCIVSYGEYTEGKTTIEATFYWQNKPSKINSFRTLIFQKSENLIKIRKNQGFAENY